MSGDLSAALATLPDSDRETVLAWLYLLGMEPEDLAAVPPLRQMVAMVAVLLMAEDMDDLPRADRFEEAARALGFKGSSMMRTWYRWQDNAVRQFVMPEEGAA